MRVGTVATRVVPTGINKSQQVSKSNNSINRCQKVLKGLNNCQCLNKCQQSVHTRHQVPTSANKCQQVSTSVNRCQQASISHRNKCQQVSADVGKSQHVSTSLQCQHLNQSQWASMSINKCQCLLMLVSQWNAQTPLWHFIFFHTTTFHKKRKPLFNRRLGYMSTKLGPKRRRTLIY